MNFPRNIGTGERLYKVLRGWQRLCVANRNRRSWSVRFYFNAGLLSVFSSSWTTNASMVRMRHAV